MSIKANEVCELCERKLILTEHHLIPKEMHNKKWCQREFTVEERKERKAYVCHDCHDAIHKLISNKDLAKEFNTVDKLKRHDKLNTFIEWVSKSNNRKFKY
jgi:uncharacterized protein YlaI